MTNPFTLFEWAELRGAGIGGWCIRRVGEPHPLDQVTVDAATARKLRADVIGPDGACYRVSADVAPTPEKGSRRNVNAPWKAPNKRRS